MSYFDERIAHLQGIISSYVDVPCNGKVYIEDHSTLFYKSRDDTSAGFIDFRHPTDVQLQDLLAVCQFDEPDVLDESNSKVGEMDTSGFSMRFSPAELGITKIVGDRLLPKPEEGKYIWAELFGLNVCGPGGFFKSHGHGPSHDSCRFGVLVIVLPTVHEGGSLRIRHRQKTWTFETAKTVNLTGFDTEAAFIAFPRDAELEVMPVTSGYRVSLIYYLTTNYIKYDETADLTIPDAEDIELDIKNAMADLLENSPISDRGGYIGFGLSYEYFFQGHDVQMSSILPDLQGIDSAIQRACASLSLGVELKVYYTENGNEGTGEGALSNRFIHANEYGARNAIAYEIKDRGDGELVWNLDSRGDAEDGDVSIIWVKPLVRPNSYTTKFIASGEAAALEYAYYELCLVVSVPRQRRT